REPFLARIQTKLRPGTDDLRHSPASEVGAAAAADDGGLHVPDLAGLRDGRSGALDSGVPSRRRREPDGLAPEACRRASAAPGDVSGDEVTLVIERGGPPEPISPGLFVDAARSRPRHAGTCLRLSQVVPTLGSRWAYDRRNTSCHSGWRSICAFA